MARKYTNRLLEMVEEFGGDRERRGSRGKVESFSDSVLRACLLYMSEDDVYDMAQANEYLSEEDIEELDTSHEPRKATNKLLEYVDEGMLRVDDVILGCVKYMSEDEVQDMMEYNGFIEPDELDDVEENPRSNPRKITEAVAAAFAQGKKKKVGNTETDGNSFWLHNNKIAKIEGGILLISFAGWATSTTRERINGILQAFGIKARTSISKGNVKIAAPDGRVKIIDSNEWIGVGKVRAANPKRKPTR